MKDFLNENLKVIHAEFFILLIALLGCFYLLYNKIERQNDRQSKRTDRLYEMFVHPVKDKRSNRDTNHRKP